jgi:transposase
MVVHPLDEADQVCSSCGRQLQLWKGQADETEEVDVIERRFVLRRHVWPKYKCPCGGCVEQAWAEPKVVPGGRYSNDFAIEVAIGKYLDHQPLERQARIFSREGLDVDSQTLWDQINALVRLLAPLMGRLRAMALAAKVVGFDETRWPVLSKAARKAWTMWQLSTRQVVYFSIAPSRDKVAGGRFLEGFGGIAIGDAAAVHRVMAQQNGFTMAYCWAHARRYFIEAEKSEPIRAAQFLEMVQRLYTIEAQAPPGPDGDDIRLQLRREKSKPILDEIRKWLDAQRFLPSSAFGVAMKYVAGHWHGLGVFIDNPEVPIDNNRTERGFRAPALGRHNFYGSKSKRGTEVAALFYTLCETAKLNGVEPKAYLKLAVKAALAGEVIPLPHELASAQHDELLRNVSQVG